MTLLHKLLLITTFLQPALTKANAQNTPNDVPVSIASLPACATPTLLQILKDSGCAATDSTCLCAYPNIRTDLIAAAAEACSTAADQRSFASFADGFCVSKVGTTTTTTATKRATTMTGRRPSATAVVPTSMRRPGVTQGGIVSPLVTTATKIGPGHGGATATSGAGTSEATQSTTTTVVATPIAIGGAGVRRVPGMGSWFALAAAVAAMTWAFAEL